MTLPYERGRSLENTERFLSSLLDSKKTPGVPKKIRAIAGACLRHFPNEYEREVMAQKMPEMLANDY